MKFAKKILIKILESFPGDNAREQMLVLGFMISLLGSTAFAAVVVLLTSQIGVVAAAVLVGSQVLSRFGEALITTRGGAGKDAVRISISTYVRKEKRKVPQKN